MEFALDRGGDCRQGRAVEIVDCGGEHEDREDKPAGARRVGGRGHWTSMVATSPLVPSRALRFAQYSIVSRRAFCMPHPSVCSPPPPIEILPGSTTNSFSVAPA